MIMTTTSNTRKTAKYYRDILSGNDTRKSLSVLHEVIKKFGSKRWSSSKGNDIIYLRGYTEFEWNHRINAFGINSQGRVYADIYWQGDSTDGDTSEYASDLINGKVIPAESEWLGDRTYYKHGDLRITREEFANALKAVAAYLAPDEIKKRKLERERSEKSSAVFDMLDAQKKELERWEMEGFWNGRIAVQKLLETEPALYDLPLDQLKKIALEVWENNNKSDYSLRGGWYDGEKKYNLAYTPA